MPKKTGTIHIKWVRSGIGFPRMQKEVVRSIGLRHLNQIVERPDTVHFRGLVAKVRHLVELVDPPSSAAWISTPEYTIIPAEASPKVSAPPAKKAAKKTSAKAAAAIEAEAETPRKKPVAAKTAGAKSSVKKASASAEKPKRKTSAPKAAAKKDSKPTKGKK